MAYVAQLLPDEAQAKCLREAMIGWLNDHSDDRPEAEVVAMHALYAKFMEDWHKHIAREKAQTIH
jgi:hypothetical protein